MGYYINLQNGGTTYNEKLAKLRTLPGVTDAPTPLTFQPNLVCVVDNGLFAAVAYAYSEEEMNDFSIYGTSERPKTWLIVPNADILSGYTK